LGGFKIIFKSFIAKNNIVQQPFQSKFAAKCGNDTQHDNAQHKGLICGIQHK